LGVERVGSYRTHGAVLGHKVVVTGFTSSANDGSSGHGTDYNTRDGSSCDGCGLRLLVVQKYAKNSSLSSVLLEVGLLLLFALSGLIVAHCVETSNILVGANSGLKNTPCSEIASLDGAEIGCVVISMVHGTRFQRCVATNTFNACVVESTLVKDGAL
jgi:hypothetical protein